MKWMDIKLSKGKATLILFGSLVAVFLTFQVFEMLGWTYTASSLLSPVLWVNLFSFSDPLIMLPLLSILLYKQISAFPFLWFIGMVMFGFNYVLDLLTIYSMIQIKLDSMFLYFIDSQFVKELNLLIPTYHITFSFFAWAALFWSFELHRIRWLFLGMLLVTELLFLLVSVPHQILFWSIGMGLTSAFVLNLLIQEFNSLTEKVSIWVSGVNILIGLSLLAFFRPMIHMPILYYGGILLLIVVSLFFLLSSVRRLRAQMANRRTQNMKIIQTIRGSDEIVY